MERLQVSLSRNPDSLPGELLSEHEPVGDEPLGEGSFAVVRLVRNRRTGEYFALKCLEKHQLKIRNMMDQAKREVRVHQKLKHPNILRLERFFEDDAYCYMLLEYCERGTMRQLVSEAPNGRLAEGEAAFYFKQVVRGVEWMHRHSWIHRDLKLENMLVTATDEVKICDFGWSAEIEIEQLLQTTCGTTAYWAPEMWECAPQDQAVDQWSLGCILYEMLAGHPPFFAPDQDKLRKRVLAVQFAYPPWFSNEACHAIASLLQREPRHRLRCQDLLAHAWLRKCAGWPRVAADPSGRSASRMSVLETSWRSPATRGRTPPSDRREVSIEVGDAGPPASGLPSFAACSERSKSPQGSGRLPSPGQAVPTAHEAAGHEAHTKQSDGTGALPSTPIGRSKQVRSGVAHLDGFGFSVRRPTPCKHNESARVGEAAAAAAATPATPLRRGRWLASTAHLRDTVIAAPAVPLASVVAVTPGTPAPQSQRKASPVRLPGPEAPRDAAGRASPASPLQWQPRTPPSRGRYGGSLHVQVMTSPAPCDPVVSSSWSQGHAFGAAGSLGHPAVLLPAPSLAPGMEGGGPMSTRQVPPFVPQGPMLGLLPQPVPVPTNALPQTSSAQANAGLCLPRRLPSAESNLHGPVSQVGGPLMRPSPFLGHCNALMVAGVASGGLQPRLNGIACDVF